MPLEPDEAKKIADLGAALADIQKKLSEIPDNAPLKAEVADLRAQLAKLAPAAPPPAATDPEWLVFLKSVIPGF